jgi:hypothetical protein
MNETHCHSIFLLQRPALAIPFHKSLLARKIVGLLRCTFNQFLRYCSVYITGSDASIGAILILKSRQEQYS